MRQRGAFRKVATVAYRLSWREALGAGAAAWHTAHDDALLDYWDALDALDDLRARGIVAWLRPFPAWKHVPRHAGALDDVRARTIVPTSAPRAVEVPA